MITTAHYRTVARNSEAALEWGHAAEAWKQAILLYPRARDRNGNPSATQSALAIADIVKMSARLDACMAHEQAQHNADIVDGYNRDDLGESPDY